MPLQIERLERVLLLGGSGLLGASIIPALKQTRVEVDAPRGDEVDIRDLDRLRQRVRDLRPDLLINTAAQASVDRAEQNPDHAFAVNALGAHNVAIAALEADLPLVHISTDYVFDGNRRTPYREYHPTGLPPNLYGQSKLQGELLVRHTTPRHFIVRVAALFGEGGRQDFVEWVLEHADPATPLTIVADRFVTPTWTDDLARQLLALVRTPYFGTYHATNHGSASWFELARTALVLAGKDPAGVVSVTDDQLDSVAARPFYTALENHLLRLRRLDSMLPWREALSRRLADHTVRVSPEAHPNRDAP